jgi:hypothetical protein
MQRKKLPNRRSSQRFTFTHGKLDYTATLGYYDPGMNHLGEIFITCGKTGSDANLAMLEAATAMSFALQYGADVETVRRAMPRRVDGSPEGPLGALLDLLARTALKDTETELLR